MHHLFSDLSPQERSRTLSNKANKFDAKRIRTKPEIKYRLKLVKADSEPTEASNDPDAKDNSGKPIIIDTL